MKMNVNMKMLLPVSILLLRLVNIFVVQTWFVPDELFQSVEVAYHVVFSTGHLAWEWTNSLRSIIHPYSIAIFYYLLKIFDLDSNFAIIFIPKLLHSLLVAMGDVCFYSLAKRLLPSFDAKFALFNYLMCWFVLYCAPRTLSNSVETALTLIALKWYPFKSTVESSNNRACWPYMSIATLAILIRPTAVLIWIPLGLWHLVRSKSRLELIIFTCLPAMLPVLVVAFLLDSFAYGEWTFSAWNFAKFNVFQGGSAHFGTNLWHYFITNGLPAVLSVQLIPVIGGCFVAIRYRQVTLSLLLTSLFYITFHSGLAHKEHRFLLPIIPFLCIYAGHFFGYLRRAGAHGNGKFVGISRLLMILVLGINIPLTLYLGLYHQIGPISTAKFIANRARLLQDNEENRMGDIVKNGAEKLSIVQLMPCYSMPQYSYFHGLHNCAIRALDCSPNLLNESNYVAEADRFHVDPLGFVQTNPNLIQEATYIVAYEKTFRLIEEVVLANGFVECSRIFHSHFLTSNREDNFIIVACRQ